MTVVVGKVIPSPWGQQHMHRTQVKAASGQRPCRARGRGKERQERVSGSETDGSRGASASRPSLQNVRTRHRAPGSVRRRGRRRSWRKTPRARASRQPAGGTDSESHRAPPADCVLLLEEQSHPKQMTFHPPRVQKTVRAHAPLRSLRPTPTGPQADPKDTHPADNLSRGNTVLTRS